SRRSRGIAPPVCAARPGPWLSSPPPPPISVVESFPAAVQRRPIAFVRSCGRLCQGALDAFIAQALLRDELEIDALVAGLVLDPAVSSLVPCRTRRPAAPVDDERDADAGSEQRRRAYCGGGSVDAQLREEQVVVGGRAYCDAKRVGIGADDEPAALELSGSRGGLRSPDDDEVRVRRRRVESSRDQSCADALPLRPRRTDLRLNFGPAECCRGERGRTRRNWRGQSARAQLRSDARRGDAVADT